jgi:hypothetical protein
MVLFLLLLLTGYGIIKSLYWPLIQDAPIIHYVAQQMLSGAVPYKDIFDVQMPGTFLIHLFVIKVIGDGSFAWRMFDLGCLFLISVFMFLFLSKRSKAAAVMSPLLFAIFHMSLGPKYMGQRDYLQSLFILASSYFLSAYLGSKRKNSYLYLAGFGLGAATTIKPYTLLLIVFFAGVIIFYEGTNPRNWIASILKFGIGSTIIPGLILFWLIGIDAFTSFVQIIFEYLIPFYSNIRGLDFISLMDHLRASRIIIPLIALAALSIIQKIKISHEIFIATVGLVYGFLHYVLQGHGFVHHRYPFILFSIILFSVLVSEFLYKPNSFLISFNDGKLSSRVKLSGFFSKQNLYKLFSLVNLIIVVVSLGLPMVKEVQKNYTLKRRMPYIREIRREIEAYGLTESDSIQVMDSVMGGIHILYLLDIKQPTRFIFDFQFFHDEEEQFIKDLRSEFVNDLNETPPRLIIIMNKSVRMGFERIDRFPEFKTFLDQNYSLDKESDDYKIYLLNDPSITEY